MVRTFMSSLLARQVLVLKDKFLERYPSAWLVWEPGVWHAADVDIHTDATKLPSGPEVPAQPQRGDALCFALEPATGRQSWVLGRSQDCDLVMPDATVS